ncbi:MAG TPA: hypothetical protein VJP76_04255 [Candidatus Tumulicola sp.]|nr:hypothetical protein [Candidatus Tumulicola sp.]
MGRTTHEPSPLARLDPRAARAVFAALAVACAISVWPLAASGTIPAFQQDWAWPLSRGTSLQWLHAFAGMWDERSLGQGNALPWQTYAVISQVGAILVFGASLGLAVWLAAVETAAAWACALMLGEFGVRSPVARFAAALLYALGPVTFTRVAAGHMAYLLAYALLPLAIYFAARTIARGGALPAVALGATAGAAGCQIQFLAIAWLAIALLPAALPRTPRWGLRLSAAFVLSSCVQLQAALPLLFSSTASLYAAQPPLLNFEYNNSAQAASAAVMLGYFTNYYESHALAGAFAVLYILVAGAIGVALWTRPRAGAYAAALAVCGFVLTAGLYGPLSVPLAWAFLHVPWFAVFRDLHYFAALTALGTSLALGIALARLRAPVAWVALALVGWIVAPALGAGELRQLLVPRAYVADALTDMRTVAARGPGRVLWLPADEPEGLRGAANRGRDFTAYGPPGNPSVSDDYQNPQLAYALATLRDRKPDWKAFAAMNVRYLVFRSYVESARFQNFGNGFPMAFRGANDREIGDLLKRSPQLRALQSTKLSQVYELPSASGSTYVARVDPNAALYSQLAPHAVGIDRSHDVLRLRASAVTANPREDWVFGAIGWRYRPWLPDSIYPFVWTLSGQPLTIRTPAAVQCVLAAAVPKPAVLHAGLSSQSVRGTWRPYRLHGAADRDRILLPSAGSVTAVSSRPCDPPPAAAPQRAFVFASGYDAGWRAIESGRPIAPVVANGWMMAWDAGAAGARLEYLPAYAQAAGVATTLLVLSGAFAFARRRDRAAVAARPAAPSTRR